MKRKIFVLLALLCMSAPLVARQAPVWTQCGGIGWTGTTTCVAGSTCVKANDYFSQCQPATGHSHASCVQGTSKVCKSRECTTAGCDYLVSECVTAGIFDSENCK